MRLPRKAIVGHRTYKIRVFSPARRRQLGIDGQCDYGAGFIWIAGPKCLPAFERANVLLHELTHACWDAAGLGKRADEERAVTALSNVLTQVMRDNPRVLRWLRLSARKRT